MIRRFRFLVPLVLLTLLTACGPQGGGGGGPDVLSGDPEPLSSYEELFRGAPSKADLPRDDKADAVYPKQFDLVDLQSPVRNQGRRGTCSIFSTTGLMEHLYIAAGMADPDFSEQYLQWSVKTQVGAFPNSAGSNARNNLTAINRYGIVEERYWPYESRQWSSSDDPECTGEKMPTKCYTNGDPPPEALEAEKFHLPRGRWLHPDSIKAHMTSKRTGVVIGVEFFYQAWNHGGSKLPIDNEFKRMGYVTTPNEEDIRDSRERPAGHSILIVGWDDDLEVPMRDGDGTILKDADGNTRTEKGFYIFKNSWGTGRFGVDNPYGDGYGFISYDYVSRYATAYVSDLPDIAPPVEICDDGADNDGNGETDCDDVACASSSLCGATGAPVEGESMPAAPIPDNDPTGITDTIEVAESGTVKGVTVYVEITHTYRGDLRVVLEHAGKEVVLHDRSGGGADNLSEIYSLTEFNGTSVSGAWTLKVSDSYRADTGTLDSWGLEIAR